MQSHLGRHHDSTQQQSTPAFWIATAVAVMCIAVIFVWSASDCSFRMAAWQAKVSFRLEPIPIDDPELADAFRRIDFDRLGLRVILLSTSVVVGLVSTATLVVLTVTGFTPHRLALCGSILLSWVILIGTHEQLDDWRSRRQVAAISPSVERVGVVLNDQWPAASGEIVPGFDVYASPNSYPDVLLIRERPPSYPFRECLGYLITRGSNGVIRFDLQGAYDSNIEFHPNGTLPTAYISCFGHPSPSVASVFRLEEHWYLVRYGRS